MLLVSYQHYVNNLKNGDNYTLKSEIYVSPERLIKGEAEMKVFAVGNNKNISYCDKKPFLSVYFAHEVERYSTQNNLITFSYAFWTFEFWL